MRNSRAGGRRSVGWLPWPGRSIGWAGREPGSVQALQKGRSVGVGVPDPLDPLPEPELAAFSLVEIAQVDQEGDGLVVLLRFRGAGQGVDALPGALAVLGEGVQVAGPGECGSAFACRPFAVAGRSAIRAASSASVGDFASRGGLVCAATVSRSGTRPGTAGAG